MRKRILGKTNEKLSIVGFGGIILDGLDEKTAQNYVDTAINYGVNYFDVSPSYGNAEEVMGPVLEKYRKNIFLSCKTDSYNYENVKKDLENSLKRLRTDYFDLYQFHAITEIREVDMLFSQGGIDALIEAKEKGLIKYIGFSSHSQEAALAMMDRFDFDTIMFPVNFANWEKGYFGEVVLNKAKEKNMGIIAIKTLAKRKWLENEERGNLRTWYKPVDNKEEAELAMKFTLSKGVTVCISPNDFERFVWMCEIEKELDETLSENEINKIHELIKDLNPVFPLLKRD
ncbi:aldo/keto reductase [Marinitoga litoralis]|uniref:aldo/keto reductase n=1 Tax=Marinitoga litoralis TaxID=570855 RepID=UPI00195F4290|nr:aldo/keto reductase [Marinitoga litoralis]MBM7559270.1 putative aldo/keto reductase-like oxidoreductase [Marinitoga litoralis]